MPAPEGQNFLSFFHFQILHKKLHIFVFNHWWQANAPPVPTAIESWASVFLISNCLLDHLPLFMFARIEWVSNPYGSFFFDGYMLKQFCKLDCLSSQLHTTWVLWHSSDTKIERFLHKNQHTQRKLLNFENWTNGEPQQLAKIKVFKVDYYILPLFLVPKLRSVAQNEGKKHPYIFFLLSVQK